MKQTESWHDRLKVSKFIVSYSCHSESTIAFKFEEQLSSGFVHVSKSLT